MRWCQMTEGRQNSRLEKHELSVKDSILLYTHICKLTSCSTEFLRYENTSTVIPASSNRRQKGNPVVSDETVMYGYESSATLTTDRLHYKLQTRSLVRECSPRQRAKQLSCKRKEQEKDKSGHGPKGVSDTKTDVSTDRRSQLQLNSTQLNSTRLDSTQLNSTQSAPPTNNCKSKLQTYLLAREGAA
jgi:hypothetical protein